MTIAQWVLALSWISKFILIWLMIFRIVPRNDLFAWGIFLSFWIISFLTAGSIMAENARKKGKDSEE